MSRTQNPSSGSTLQGWPDCEQDWQAGSSSRPSFENLLLDSSGWGLPGPFLLLLPLSKPGSFGTVEVGREGGACCPAKIGSFPVVGIPKGMALACLGNDASGHSTSRRRLCRQELQTEELQTEEL